MPVIVVAIKGFMQFNSAYNFYNLYAELVRKIQCFQHAYKLSREFTLRSSHKYDFMQS
jgi:hypothetical protein